jgi:hypothetical protein
MEKVLERGVETCRRINTREENSPKTIRNFPGIGL